MEHLLLMIRELNSFNSLLMWQITSYPYGTRASICSPTPESVDVKQWVYSGYKAYLVWNGNWGYFIEVKNLDIIDIYSPVVERRQVFKICSKYLFGLCVNILDTGNNTLLSSAFSFFLHFNIYFHHFLKFLIKCNLHHFFPFLLPAPSISSTLQPHYVPFLSL